MISQTAEYALRAVVHLASRTDNTKVADQDGRIRAEYPRDSRTENLAREESQTALQIAAATQVPVGYLSKVLQSLRRAGLIVSRRGLHGGFKLARSPRTITIYEVLQAVDPLPRIRRCPLDLPAHSVHLCPLHQRLDDAMAHVEQAFNASYIADLIDLKLFPDSCTREPAGGHPATTKGRVKSSV